MSNSIRRPVPPPRRMTITDHMSVLKRVRENSTPNIRTVSQLEQAVNEAIAEKANRP